MCDHYEIKKNLNDIQNVYETVKGEAETICSLTVMIDLILRNYESDEKNPAIPDSLEDAVTFSQIISEAADSITAEACRLLMVRQEIKKELGLEYEDSREENA